MDWQSWLSKSNLEPGLVRELSLLFSANELEREDIAHLNHESLQSIGIAIAKHRIEILKLAQQEKKKPGSPRRTVARWLPAAVTRVAEHLRSLVHRDTSAIVVVPRPAPSQGAAFLRRNRQAKQVRAARLTDGRAKTPESPVAGTRGASPVVYRREEMRWVSMFQDIKPT